MILYEMLKKLSFIKYSVEIAYSIVLCLKQEMYLY